MLYQVKRRQLRAPKPVCGIYECENEATLKCNQCRKRTCADCLAGHEGWHQRRAVSIAGTR